MESPPSTERHQQIVSVSPDCSVMTCEPMRSARMAQPPRSERLTGRARRGFTVADCRRDSIGFCLVLGNVESWSAMIDQLTSLVFPGFWPLVIQRENRSGLRHRVGGRQSTPHNCKLSG